MYIHNHSQNLTANSGYVPYFYEAGLFLSYGNPTNTLSKPGQPLENARYDFTSDPHPWQNLRQSQTVEQIISSGYFAVPRAEPEIALISDREHTSRLGLEDTIRQIRHRYELYEQNVYELNQSVCEAENSVFRQVAAQGTPADNRQQYSASKMVQGLYEQMRLERVGLWKDVSKLRLLLPETAQNYLAAYRKMSILEDTGGDGT